MLFKDIPCHENIKARLRTLADTGRLPHALLLEGGEGTGKMALARAFVQYVQCTGRAPGDTDSCGKCVSCLHHNNMSHIDTHYVFPVVKLDGMTNPPISDDFLPQWLEYMHSRTFMDFGYWTQMFEKKNAQPTTYVTESNALIRKLSFTSHESRYKAVIWWLPEKMNEETANKLLKILEEPYPDTLFVMVSDNPAAILPTVYSRVQRIAVPGMSDAEIAAVLTDSCNIDPTDALAIAHTAEGNMSAALRNLGNRSDESEFFNMFVSLMRLAYQRKIHELKDWAADLADRGREQEMKFYAYSCRLIRENFIFNFNLPQLNYMSNTERAFSSKFARFITERNVEKLIEVLNNARTDIAGNANGKIVNLDLAVKVILLLKQ